MSTGLPPEVPNPQLNIAIQKLREAGRAIDAHGELCRLRNTQQQLNPQMDAVTIQQRSAILDVASRALWSDVLRMLDDACSHYQQARRARG
jgi:hypothetical protein